MDANWYHIKDPKTGITFVYDGETKEVIGHILPLRDGRFRAMPNGKKVSDFYFESAARSYIAAAYFSPDTEIPVTDNKKMQYHD